MANTTPNKETVRRICLLSGASICYLLVDTGDEYAEVVTDIELPDLENCINELKSWCGMNFRLYTTKQATDYKNKIARIRACGEKILPIQPEEMDKFC